MNQHSFHTLLCSTTTISPQILLLLGNASNLLHCPTQNDNSIQFLTQPFVNLYILYQINDSLRYIYSRIFKKILPSFLSLELVAIIQFSHFQQKIFQRENIFIYISILITFSIFRQALYFLFILVSSSKKMLSDLKDSSSRHVFGQTERDLKIVKKYSSSSNFENDNCLICQQMTIKTYHKSFYTCDHKELCLGCMIQYSKSCLNQNSMPKCLTPNCSGTLKDQKQSIMSQFPVQMMEDFRRAIKEKKMKNNRKCTIPDCPGFIKNGTCNICLTIFCERCYRSEHLGPCTLSFLLPSETKQCPQCGQGIQQDGGCLHMTCLRCHYNFCFKCLQAWSQSHHACQGGKSLVTAILGWFLD